MKVVQNTASIERTATGRKPAVSLLVAVYNNADTLALVWASIQQQTHQDFEVVFCDDGSSTENVQRLLAAVQLSPIPVQHVWQPDMGFRKNRILDLGVMCATAEYLVFIDGDCILHPRFVADHDAGKMKGGVLAGRRAELTPRISGLLTVDKIRSGYLQRNFWWILVAISTQSSNNGTKGIALRSARLRALLNTKERGVVGCNFSLWRSDLMAINGFDTRYEGPGYGEDSDVEYRLRLQGIRIIPFSNAAVQYHVWHRLRERSSQNEALYGEVIAQKNAITRFGIAECVSEEVVHE